jgi:hypothetical protein
MRTGNLLLKITEHLESGMLMPGRNFVADKDRFEYQEQYNEKDDETEWNSF